MTVSVEGAIAVFILLAVTIPAIIAGTLNTRSKYYTKLGKRVEQLEAKDEKSYLEIQRLRAENTTLQEENIHIKELVTGHAELEKLVELFGNHDEEARERHQTTFDMLRQILSNQLEDKRSKRFP